MRVLFYCHYWAPYHFAGSEMMGQNILRHLRDAGHETYVLCTSETPDTLTWEFEGTMCTVPDVGRSGHLKCDEIKPDIILTHHNATAEAVAYARHANIPVVQIIHNDMRVSEDNVARGADLVIYNTEWIRRKFSARFDVASCVLHPPVYSSDHSTSPGDCVTLVNMNANKGAHLFYKLAERMPDVQFLAVEGGHGPQIFEPWPNVKVQWQTTNMRDDVWSRTKILLMPSIYESYGMAGVEALASGIPVIAHPTPGLRESLGDAGTFLDRDDVIGWELAIRSLLSNRDKYKDLASKARRRSAELDPEKELFEVTQRLEELYYGVRNSG